MDMKSWAADNLAARLLAGAWTRKSIAAGIRSVVGPGERRARRALVAGIAELGEGTYPPAPHALKAYLLVSPFFNPVANRPVAAVLDPPLFTPIGPFASLPIPALATPGALAEWLGLPAETLNWLADERRSHGRAVEPDFQHYRYVFLDKQGGKKRLIEAPKPRLKAIQRKILREIVSAAPVHECANGFVAGRSCLTGAQVHASEALVVTFDLAEFFPSISQPRVHGVFRSLGYPWAVARILASLCTTVTPAGVLRDIPEDRRALHGVAHLPQGAPTSPALANLLAFRLDRRLHGLARAAGANYTRYAHDLAFSGAADFAKGLGRFQKAVQRIATEEGYSLNVSKTRIMPRHGRQRITGIVVNEHCNVSRAEFDALRAILYNCMRTGPVAQSREGIADFRAYLGGRISWVEQINPPRGEKLRKVFERIDWG